MWGWRRRIEAQLETERAKVVLLERQLATSQANVDWLRVMVNNLSHDRAAIAASRGLSLPAPQLEGALRTPADVTAAVAGDGGGAPAALGVGSALANPDVDEAMEAFQGLTNGFEDVGDEEAERIGAIHAEDGTLEFRH